MLTILLGDAIEQLRTLPSESVHCCVTSPPYWGLRDYGTAAWDGGDSACGHVERTGRNDVTPERLAERAAKYATGQGEGSKVTNIQFGYACGKCGAKRIDSQLGLEKTPEEYVRKMVEVFREVRRVLRKDGTLWLNLGDSYAASQTGSFKGGGFKDTSAKNGTRDMSGVKTSGDFDKLKASGLKPKDLCGIPWRVAFALQADGWWLRSDIIWAKPNPMPESVTDRCTKSHEYLFMLTKSANYYFDAEAIKERGVIPEGTLAAKGSEERFNTNGVNSRPPEYKLYDGNRNKRSVWTVATAPYPEAHFATYPPDLIKPCIMAGTSAKGCCAKCGTPWDRIVESRPMVIDRSSRTHELGRTRSSGTMVEPARSETIGWQPTCYCYDDFGGSVTEPCTVLDPFAGSGTTGMAALELGRKSILIELNPKYVELIRQRCDVTPGLQLA